MTARKKAATKTEKDTAAELAAPPGATTATAEAPAEASPAAGSSPATADGEKPADRAGAADQVADLEELDAEGQRAIIEAEREIRAAELAEERAKEEVKEAKAYTKQCGLRLRQLIRELYEPNLFTKRKTNGDGNGHTAEQQAEADDWRAFPIADLDLPESIVAKLTEANVCTMGDLADFTDPNKHGGAHRDLTMIKGIGPGLIAKIEAATTKFWAERPAPKEPEPAAAPAAEPEPATATATATAEASA